MAVKARAAILLAVLVIMMWAPVVAAQALHLHSRTALLKGPDWTARDVDVRLERDDQGSGALAITIGELILPEPLPPLAGVNLSCEGFVFAGRHMRCPSGRLSLEGLARDRVAGRVSFDYRLTQDRLNFTITDLAFAGGRIGLRGGLEGTAWKLRVEGSGLSLAAAAASLGELTGLAMNPEAASGKLDLKASFAGEQGRIVEAQVQLRHPGVITAEAVFALDTEAGSGTIRRARITLGEVVLPAAYSAYIQPFAANTGVQALQVQGRLQGRIDYARDGLRALDLEFMDVSLEDVPGRFGIHGLGGRLAWALDARQRRSRLSWSNGHVYGVPVGAGQLRFEIQDGALRLLRPARIPVLDGVLRIEALVAADLGTEAAAWRVDGALTPLSMEALSRTLNWPPLSGTLSGVIPDVRYAKGHLRVGGALGMGIFGGDITITDLRLEDPFGDVPRLFAHVDIRGVDLLTLTQALDFGKIEGKLDGSVRDLRLEHWRPVQFDAAFFSAHDGDTSREISQRALENISALSGGGVTEALSRGFLGMFKAFRYKRLGIRCRLAKGICEMGGVAPAGEGYYLVEGGGLPRIDVIGYNRRVDWHDLVARLKAAVGSDSPVVR